MADANTRRAFADKMKARIDELEAEINELEAETRKSHADARREEQEWMRDLHDRRKKAIHHLEMMDDYSTEAWDEFKRGADNAYEELADGIRRARDSLRAA